MPVVIQDFETLPADGGGDGAGADGRAPRSESAARVAAERTLRRLARRHARLRG